MHLVLGGINGNYLRDITENCAPDTEEVLAAVAYATDASLLFDWCWTKSIPLKFFGRLDDCIAVTTPILADFLARASPIYVCRLVQHHHAKVIWWRGFGMYIGSANLTHSAWHKNVEAGCFFKEEELNDEMAGEIEGLFSRLNENSTPLTQELFNEMKYRESRINATPLESKSFWESSSIRKWSGLVQTSRHTLKDRRKEAFLKEWYGTLEELRNIGKKISLSEYRPYWVAGDTPVGAQTDQFLHAHYYQRTFDGRKAVYSDFFEANKGNSAAALEEAMRWWKQLPVLEYEAKMLNETAPFLQKALSAENVSSMIYSSFFSICNSVHAIRDYARRVPNAAVGLPDSGGQYSISEKVTALSKRIWDSQSSDGARVKSLLNYILYDGVADQLPERLWQGVSDPKRRIDGLGISALGEIVGWALPDKFPPRNGRTSKALRSLGFDVTIHVQ